MKKSVRSSQFYVNHAGHLQERNHEEFEVEELLSLKRGFRGRGYGFAGLGRFNGFSGLKLELNLEYFISRVFI